MLTQQDDRARVHGRKHIRPALASSFRLIVCRDDSLTLLSPLKRVVFQKSSTVKKSGRDRLRLEATNQSLATAASRSYFRSTLLVRLHECNARGANERERDVPRHKMRPEFILLSKQYWTKILGPVVWCFACTHMLPGNPSKSPGSSLPF